MWLLLHKRVKTKKPALAGLVKKTPKKRKKTSGRDLCWSNQYDGKE